MRQPIFYFNRISHRPSRGAAFYPALVLILALLASACAHRQVTEELPSAEVTFRSEALPYAITYDLNRWRILAPHEQQALLADSDFVLSDGQGQFFMSIIGEFSTATVTELRTTALVGLQQRGPDLRVLHQSPVTIAGEKGILVRLGITMRDTPLMYEIAFLQKDGVAYQFIYWAGQERFHERAGDFRALLKSFAPVRTVARQKAFNVAYPSPGWGYMINLPYPEWRASTDRSIGEADLEFRARTNMAWVTVIPQHLNVTLPQMEQMVIEGLRQSTRGRFALLRSEAFQIDGRPARIIEGEADGENGKFRYLVAFIIRNGTAFQIAGWAPAALFEERYREQFEAIFAGMEFL
jgi:hypothetical protein